jgi:type II secretory pathway component PulF
MFSARIHTKSLALACRSLSTMLDAGVPIERAFRVTADKTGDSRCAATLRGIADSVADGNEVADGMREQGQRFPDLVIEMVAVAEQTGTLPEILKGLAEHYENNLRLRREFLASITWPCIQFVLAVLVIALMIYILGWIAESRGGKPLDVLGFGLVGAKGAIVWLAMVIGAIVSLVTAYVLIANSLTGKRALDGFLLGVPVVGHCMRSFAIARFSWAFYLTQQSGMSIDKSLQSSLRATNNGAFIGAGDAICRRVNEGDDLATALRASRLFPIDFLSMVEVAEHSGTVPEALHRLSPQFEDNARRALAALTVFLGWLVWGIVAAFIIFFIFRIALWYVGMINDAVRAIK